MCETTYARWCVIDQVGPSEGRTIVRDRMTGLPLFGLKKEIERNHHKVATLHWGSLV